MSTVQNEFNRPRVCLGCGERAYPRDPDVIVKNMVRHKAYFCDSLCLKRWKASNIGDEELEPLFGEALSDGAAALLDDDPTDVWLSRRMKERGE